jgi:hypothetical protein
MVALYTSPFVRTINDRRTLYEDIRDIEHLGTKVKISKGYTPPRLNANSGRPEHVLRN